MNRKFRMYRLLLLATLLAGCAHVEDRKLNPKVIYKSGDAIPTQIVLEETEHIYRVFTPEGLRNSVSSSDFEYFLEEPNGTVINLPFLTTNNADDTERIKNIFHNEENACWIGLNIAPTKHFEHVRGLFEWRRVDDDYIKMRVKTFSRNKLLSERNISICTPLFKANPVVEYNKTKSALRYCTEQGTTLYLPAEDIFKIENTNSCCPTAIKGTDLIIHRGYQRYNKEFLLETGVKTF